eukprot:CAMPEP_0197175128 /NCGR_PEP_ID=MMETSP1423-20130617/1428_1 /TAXON_ID=476441 /ORGANISM="Pseudo-nitzschia heimii, Strain UNC1101" /LENGTH=707 /DNA_ID=CAMNT_0042624203 /DNA_START=88 /DNA_END=2211 /DNA_ORIENTATION=+
MNGDDHTLVLDPAETGTSRNPSTGTRPDEPISLLNDDDDDDHDENDAGGNDHALASGTQGSAQSTIIDRSNVSTVAAATASDRNVDGCMLNPRNPIKIFATDRDKVVRRRLRKSLATIDGGAIGSGGGVAVTKDFRTEQEYLNHWSTFHCWTFREMLGFDRFSGLRRQQQQQQQQQQQRQKTLQKDTLVENRVGIDWIFLTTYILDVDFLLNELPELVHVPIVVLLYHYKDESPSGREAAWIQRAAAANHRLVFLVRDPRAAAGTVTNPRGPTMGYGCHHTKMTLVRYSSGRLRVHIHTSNMRREDVHDKCQGAFLQDFWPKTEDQLASFVTSGFEESLATYLESYDFRTPMVWIDHDPSAGDDAETLVSHLQTYDFSTAVAVLIPSVPGYHKIHARRDSNNDKIYGYLKVQRAIRDHCGAKTHNAQPNRHRGNGPGSIVCQFSSMGALSKPYLTKLADAWNVDAVTAPSIAGTSAPRGKRPRTEPRGASTIPSFSLLRIVWPTIEEIVTSVEGRNGGASVPGRTKNLHRDFIGPLLHTWRSNSGSTNDGLGDGRCDDLHFGKGRHVPHIKSYYQICNNDDDGDDESDRGIGNAENMRWFVLSSHNLSKAAWGEIQYRRDVQTEVLVVQHWELGVFLAPSTLGVDAMGPLSTPGIFRKGPTTNGTGRIKSPKCVDTDDSSGTRAIIPLPYKFQPDRYRDTDQPWVVA